MEVREGERPPALRVELLGGFRVVVDGQPVPDRRWRLRRARDVVALLALTHGHRVQRDEAMEKLWPDEAGAISVNSLHQVLHVARRALDEAQPRRFLSLRGDLLSLTEGEAVSVDVADAEALVAAARREGGVERWRAAAETCSLELLPEARYQEWTAPWRQAVERLADEALAGLAAALEQAEGRSGVAASAAGAGRAGAGRRASREDAAPPHNLPVSINSFVGRGHQLAELEALLRRTRLLTLSGPGGAGKTRLACELARRTVATVPGGAWFVDLGPLSDASLVLSAVAEALGVRPRPGDALLPAVTGRLAPVPSLLVLDNCEHLLAACAEYAETLLRECPVLTVLATSREPLRVAGEVVWRTPSLSLPGETRDARTLRAAEAVQLLLDRACAVDPGFVLEDANAADVARLCQRLDGLPLAIELAAARLGTLSPGQLVDRLDERFRLLTAGSRTALTRQQTLAATLDWSHDLLDERQRIVLRRLSVFAGGFELEAAERVCAGAPVSEDDIAAVVAELAEKSLVAVEAQGATRRHRLLETIRAYARGHLAAAGELEATARRHAQWCADLGERAEPMLSSRDEPAWLRRLERENDNVRAAMAWALDRDPVLLARLAAAFARFWLRRLRLFEGVRWLDLALERMPDATPLRCRLLLARGTVDIRRLGQTSERLAGLEEGARVAAGHGDHLLEGRSLLLTGTHHLLFGLTGAQADFDRARRVGVRHGLDELAAAAVASAGVVAAQNGDDDAAEALLQEALERLHALTARPGWEAVRVPDLLNIGEVLGPRTEVGGRVRFTLEDTVAPFRDLGVAEAAAHVVATLGSLARLRGDLDTAACHLDSAQREFRRLRDARGVGETLARRGHLALVRGDLGTARRCFRLSRRVRRAHADPRVEGLMTAALGAVALADGDIEQARDLHDRAGALFTRAGDRPGYVAALGHRADLALVTGDLDGAERRYAAMSTWLPRSQPWTALYCSDVAEARGDRAAALRLVESSREVLARDFGRRAEAVCAARVAALSRP